MLHEIIMCLLGNIGGLFQYKIENNIKKIKVKMIFLFYLNFILKIFYSVG